MAKAYALADGFGLDRLRLTDWPAEPLTDGHVRIAIEAVSLNRRDLLLVEGRYAPRLRMPAIPCSDAAGRVIETGPGCTRFAVGDRVVAHMFPDWLSGTPTAEGLRASLGGPVRQGTLRSEIVLPETTLLAVPTYLDAREAATLPCAALTAWSAIARFGAVGPGSSVLVQGTGGVSVFALQFAKQRGATVVATSSHPDKRARLTALGADAVVDYRDPNWGEIAKRHVDGVFDLIVEVAGEIDTVLRMVRPGGMVALIGVLSGGTARITLPLVVMRQVALQGVTCGTWEDFRDMLAAMTQAELRPVISDAIPFARAHDAFIAMREGRHFGKIVIDVAVNESRS
jgi:NADPH:quinone reductase-like Zn-dependent oxidoreductase